MKYLEAVQAKRARGAISNKMLPGPGEDKGSAAARSAPAVRPEVRALADQLGVELSTVTGTGARGSITVADVRAAHAASTS